MLHGSPRGEFSGHAPSSMRNWTQKPLAAALNALAARENFWITRQGDANRPAGGSSPFGRGAITENRARCELLQDFRKEKDLAAW